MLQWQLEPALSTPQREKRLAAECELQVFERMIHVGSRSTALCYVPSTLKSRMMPTQFAGVAGQFLSDVRQFR